MTIELSNSECELLDKALEAWEKEPILNSTVMSVMTVMIAPKEERSGLIEDYKNEKSEANLESTKRRKVAVMMRSKLYQAQARASEHEDLSRST